MLDLSRWLDGEYRVAGEPTEDHVDPTAAAATDDDTAPDATPNSRYARHHHDHR
jgi:endogenous inhibitor of DNA gyrase (YacG/DUF329 family)